MTRQDTEPKAIQVQWHKVSSYEEARDFQSAVYIHDWNDEPYYIGMLGESVFGGNPRAIPGSLKYPDKSNPRYGPSYSHWIDGCLAHGANLYIGTFPLVSEVLESDAEEIKQELPNFIRFAEGLLQVQLQPVKGRLSNTPPPNIISLEHTGDIPPYLI